MEHAPRVDVVWAHAAAGAARLDVLDDRERQRLAGLATAGDRARFVTAHALVRVLAAARRGTTPAAVPLAPRCRRCGGPHGAPRLDDGGPPLWLSLTHAGDRVAVALSAAGPVGVDVEDAAATAFPAFADVALSPDECRRRAGARELDTLGRARWWARKEAVLKATGHGLTVPPSALTLTAPDEAPRLLAWDEAAAGEPAPVPLADVAVRDVDLGPGRAAAVALLYPAPGDDPVEPELHVTAGDALLAG